MGEILKGITMHPEAGSWSPEEIRKEIALYQDILETTNENWSAVLSDITEGGEPSEEHMKQLAQTESSVGMRIKELQEMLAGKSAELFASWIELGMQQQNLAKQLEGAEGQEAKDLVQSLKKVSDERQELGEALRKELESSLGAAA